MAALTGSVAVVTGAGRGIGRAIAEHLARNGMAVALVARSGDDLDDAARAITGRGGRALPCRADVTVAADMEGVAERATGELGPPGLLVNNAGTLKAIGPPWEVDPDDWWTDFESTVRGTFLSSRALLPGMIERGRGRIVNFASLFGTVPVPYLSGYAAAKAAVLRFTDSLAAAAHGTGVAVFAVSPGLVATDMTRHMTTSEPARRWLGPPDRIPEERWRHPNDVARLVVRLARGDADALTGRYITVDDDLDEMLRHAGRVVDDDLRTLRLGHAAPFSTA